MMYRMDLSGLRNHMKDASGRLKFERRNILVLLISYIIISRGKEKCLISLLDLTVVFPVDQVPLDQGLRDIFQPLRMS